MKPNRLQLMQHLCPQYMNVRFELCLGDHWMLAQEGFAGNLIFSDESASHVRGKVKTQSVRIWDASNRKEVYFLTKAGLPQYLNYAKVCHFLNNKFPRLWIERASGDCSPSYVVIEFSGPNNMRNFLLWCYIINRVFLTLVQRDLQYLC